MSRPSMTGVAGTVPPASETNVGRRSIVAATASLTEPAGTWPGHQARVGTRTPPSQVEPLPPRSGPALPPSVPLMSHGPLSEVKTTSVSLSSPCARKVSSTWPTLQSTSSTQSPKRPFWDLPANAAPGQIGVWTALWAK